MNTTYKGINRVLIFTLVLNFMVCGAKIIFGMVSKSASMVADGFHSLTDGTSNIIGLVGIWIASRPVDEGHPYGHKKFETFTTIIIAALLFVVCFEVLNSAVNRLQHPDIVPEISIYSFIVMAGTLLANIWISRYETKRGRELKSDFLVSDAKHTASDIYVSISVIVSLVVVKLGLPIIDIITSVVIALIIAKAAVEIVVHSANILCDAAPIKPDRVIEVVSKIDGVIECHKVRTRGREDDIKVDLHVWVDKDMSVEEGHSLSHVIEKMLKNNILGVSEVIVHMEPYTLTEAVED